MLAPLLRRIFAALGTFDESCEVASVLPDSPNLGNFNANKYFLCLLVPEGKFKWSDFLKAKSTRFYCTMYFCSQATIFFAGTLTLACKHSEFC